MTAQPKPEFGEPWRVVPGTNGRQVVASSDLHLVIDSGRFYDETELAHAVKCVNACAATADANAPLAESEARAIEVLLDEARAKIAAVELENEQLKQRLALREQGM